MRPRKHNGSKLILIDSIGARRMIGEMIKISIDEWRSLERAGLIVDGAINKASPDYHGEKQFQADNIHRFFVHGLEVAIQLTGLDLPADLIRQKLGIKFQAPPAAATRKDDTILIGK